MENIVLGLTAHVDAGKTTLAEALLLACGEVRTAGRVDKGNAFLDTHDIEKKRGITVFSKQALLHRGDRVYTLMDTPGHADFSAEAERALSVMDCAVLVISACDGVQSHTETLWRLFGKYNIPVFIFVNKVDISHTSGQEIINQLRSRLSGAAADFSASRDRGELLEDISAASEEIMNEYLEKGDVSDKAVARAVAMRRIFPCCFGSALKHRGIEELLCLLDRLAPVKKYSGDFGAMVYKVSWDKGARLTHMKITGGSLKVRDVIGEEKVSRIRLYSGAKFECPEQVFPGQICAVEGLSETYPGQGLGLCGDEITPMLQPALVYKVIPGETDIYTVLERLRVLEEEDPGLAVRWLSATREIEVRIMGDIQLEILARLYRDRFGEDISFGSGAVAYKETVLTEAYGIGHYEPLRHYAEVHLKISPGERGSGIVYASECPEDILERHWQRLIISGLQSTPLVGVLTGSPLTDVKITLIKGRAHLKHTEGGDFRQAAARAVRMALMRAESMLLEPWYDFRLHIPDSCTGRAMTDIECMGGELSSPQMSDVPGFSVITGRAPVSKMRGYHTEAAAYSKGQAAVSCIFGGYGSAAECEAVISERGYDPAADAENPADSVFCSHGAGVIVPWQEVEGMAHLELNKDNRGDRSSAEMSSGSNQAQSDYKSRLYSDEELMAIFERTYGKIDRDPRRAMRRDRHTEDIPKRSKPVPIPTGPEYLLVDGYNIIFAWDDLKKLASESLDLARGRLTDILCNYRGYRQNNVILVFDAYRVKGTHRETEEVCGIHVVYTKEAETADMYIEKVSRELAQKSRRVRVATSDGAEQMIILGNGAFRVTAKELYEEVKAVEREIRRIIEK